MVCGRRGGILTHRVWRTIFGDGTNITLHRPMLPSSKPAAAEIAAEAGRPRRHNRSRRVKILRFGLGLKGSKHPPNFE